MMMMILLLLLLLQFVGRGQYFYGLVFLCLLSLHSRFGPSHLGKDWLAKTKTYQRRHHVTWKLGPTCTNAFVLDWNVKLYSEPKPWCSFHHQGCGGEFAAGFPDLVLHIGPAASLLPAALGELRTAEAVWGTAIQSGARPPTLGSQRWKVNDVATWKIFKSHKRMRPGDQWLWLDLTLCLYLWSQSKHHVANRLVHTPNLGAKVWFDSKKIL